MSIGPRAKISPVAESQLNRARERTQYRAAKCDPRSRAFRLMRHRCVR